MPQVAVAIDQLATVSHAIAVIRTGSDHVLHSAIELTILVEQLKSMVARFTV